MYINTTPAGCQSWRCAAVSGAGPVYFTGATPGHGGGVSTWSVQRTIFFYQLFFYYIENVFETTIGEKDLVEDDSKPRNKH